MSKGKIEPCQPSVSHWAVGQWHKRCARYNYNLKIRRHIPKEYKEITLHLSLHENVTDNAICHFTGISEWAMKRLRKTYRETEEVTRMSVCSG